MTNVIDVATRKLDNFKLNMSKHDCIKLKSACDDIECVFFNHRVQCLEDCGKWCKNKRDRSNFEQLLSKPRDNGKLGFGVGAKRDIQPGEFVCEYLGKLRSKKTFTDLAVPGTQSEKYGLEYDDEGILIIDASLDGSLGK